MSDQYNQRPLRKWRVTAIEWLSHVAVIEAETQEQAEAQAEEFWAENGGDGVFRFKDGGLDGFFVEKM
jgi:hypothetical protein